jgi:homoserine O-acetyltransferase/O-succinyltransferase
VPKSLILAFNPRLYSGTLAHKYFFEEFKMFAIHRLVRGITFLFGCLILTNGVLAAEFPAPKVSSWIAKDFRFHTGEVMADLRISYTTVGNPTGEPVLVLHGTAGSAANMLSQAFGGELFGAGQPLDATKYFVIIPDAIGTGKSTKPSDGLKAKFPKYNYDDMVDAQYRLVTEALGIKRLRLVIGNSMGGMQTWIWAHKYPSMMDVAVPMASMPTEMSSRNWILRRLITESIRTDPEWLNGDYVKQPRSAQFASVFFAFATNGGDQGLYKLTPTRAKADELLNQRLAAAFPADANDILYQWDSSRDYNPAPHLDRITTTLMAINSADDERNPPVLGLLDREIKRVKNGRIFLIPASENTSGHGTTGQARFWKKELEALLAATPKGKP